MKVLIIMNCAGAEVLRYMSRNSRFADQNQTIYLSTYKDPPHNYLSLISSADVLIVNDVKNIHHYKFEYIVQHAASHAMVYRMPFWRFDGLWAGSHLRGSEVFFYDEVQVKCDDSSLFDHRRAFELGLEKFSRIESQGFLKMVDFISNPIQCARCFTDNWHPTPYFFFLPVATIMVELGYAPNDHVISPTGINRNRIRLFGANLSGMLFDEASVVFWLDRYVESAVYFEFQKFCKAIVDIHLINDVGFLDLVWNDFIFNSQINCELIEIPNVCVTDGLRGDHNSNVIEFEFVTKVPLFGNFVVAMSCGNSVLSEEVAVDVVSKTTNGSEYILITKNVNVNGCNLNVSTNGFDITNLIIRFWDAKSDCSLLNVKALIPVWMCHE